MTSGRYRVGAGAAPQYTSPGVFPASKPCTAAGAGTGCIAGQCQVADHAGTLPVTVLPALTGVACKITHGGYEVIPSKHMKCL